MQNKIMNVNKTLLGSTEKNRKADRGNYFDDYCQIPITDTCCILVLDHTDFTTLLYFVSVNRLLTVHRPDTTGAHHTTTRSQRQILCRLFCYISFTVTALIQKYIFPVSEYNAFID